MVVEWFITFIFNVPVVIDFYTSASLAVGSPRLCLEGENKMIPPRMKREDSVYTAASQLLKKENHRSSRLKSAAYPPAVYLQRNHMLQERI
jgi:hypothetical protein